jgi:hypothetical protein
MMDTEATAASADEQAIHDVPRAYLEAWLDGDGERMRSAPRRLSPTGVSMMRQTPLRQASTIWTLSTWSGAARGPRRQFERTCSVEILDLADNIASARVTSQPFIDYLHLAKLDGRWSIVNVLDDDRHPGG